MYTNSEQRHKGRLVGNIVQNHKVNFSQTVYKKNYFILLLVLVCCAVGEGCVKSEAKRQWPNQTQENGDLSNLTTGINVII